MNRNNRQSGRRLASEYKTGLRIFFSVLFGCAALLSGGCGENETQQSLVPPPTSADCYSRHINVAHSHG